MHRLVEHHMTSAKLGKALKDTCSRVTVSHDVGCNRNIPFARAKNDCFNFVLVLVCVLPGGGGESGGALQC